MEEEEGEAHKGWSRPSHAPSEPKVVLRQGSRTH